MEEPMTVEKSSSSLLVIMISSDSWNSVSDNGYPKQSRNKEGCIKKITLSAFSQINIFKYNRLSFPRESSQAASSFLANKPL